MTNMEEELNQGALNDERPEEEREKDYTFEETVSSVAPVKWVEKQPKEWRKFPIFDQDGSGSCVAQTLKKLLGVYVWLKTGVFVLLSASHIYQRRSNRPSGGMNAIDAWKIAQAGTTLEEFAPSEQMSDSEMDKVQVNDFEKKIGEAFAAGKYLVITDRSIDTIASIIQETGKAVMLWFYFAYKEWTDVPTVLDPNLNRNAASTNRHSVAGVDFTLYGGKKAIIIDESWGKNLNKFQSQRVITEDFLNARNYYAAHFMAFKFEDQEAPQPAPNPQPNPQPQPVDPSKPKHRFDRDLEFSATYKTDPEVVALQNCLKWVGCFPVNIDSTGYYGAITKTAVGKFQEKYGIASPKDAGYGRTGPQTRAKLNSLFA